MRILHVNKFLYRRGGAEAYMFDLAELQTAAGDEVAFFGMDHPDNEPMPYSTHFPGYVEFRAPSVWAQVRASARMFYSTSSAAGMAEVVRDFRPDMVHLHNIYHQLSPSVLRPLAKYDVPSVMTLHDYKLACPSHQFLDHGQLCEACLGGRFYNAATRRCKEGSLVASVLVSVESYAHSLTGAYAPVRLFIAPSRFLAHKMAQAGVFPDRMRHVSHFVDTGSIAPREQPGEGFVYAGRLSPEKGVDVLIRAAGLAADVKVEILGDGPERARLEQLADKVAPGRVRFHGRVGREAVHDAMRASLATVVPSVWYENQPITILESFACGVPVLGTQLGGIPELVEDGVTGYVTPARDADALAARMGDLASNPHRAESIGRAARAFVEQGFAPAKHLQRLAEIYAEAAGAREAVTA
jgi:glycosyltransferase involved in cell wall biosynthesis